MGLAESAAGKVRIFAQRFGLRKPESLSPSEKRAPNTAEQFVQMAKDNGITDADIELGVTIPDEEHPFPRATLGIRKGNIKGARIYPDPHDLNKTFGGANNREGALLSAVVARDIIRSAGIKVKIFQATDDEGGILNYDERIELSDQVVDQRARDYQAQGIHGFPISMPIKPPAA